jgi:hypothetical protein
MWEWAEHFGTSRSPTDFSGADRARHVHDASQIHPHEELGDEPFVPLYTAVFSSVCRGGATLALERSDARLRRFRRRAMPLGRLLTEGPGDPAGLRASAHTLHSEFSVRPLVRELTP